MSERQNGSASSSSSGVDYLLLCEDIVQRIEGVVNRGKLLNRTQWILMAEYLSEVVMWVRWTVLQCDNEAAFAPALAALHRYYEKAEVLVMQCGEKDWCAAAVFQGSNGISIMNIGICIDSILQDAFHVQMRSFPSKPRMVTSGIEKLAYEDREDLRLRLEGLVIERRSSNFWFFWRQAADHRAQHLAQYLLKKNKFEVEHKTIDDSLESLKPILWEKDKEPTGTWGKVEILGAGSGAICVLETSWLGVPCAKKVFGVEASSERMFMKEALTMARLKKHPSIVDFICCGNGTKKGDRFIAMELMENSLYDLIKQREGVHFSLEVAFDIIWQIADGVKFLHEQGVAHRDLKPQNVLVKTLTSPYHEDYYCVKLADFGTCKSEVEVSKSNTMSYRGIGTTRYRAPEAFPNAHPQGLGKVDWMRADAYSFAMTCAHVLTLKQPFEDMEVLSELYAELMIGRRPILSSSSCPKKLVELMRECWSNDRFKRPRFDTIYSRLKEIVFKHQWELGFVWPEKLKIEEVD